MYARRRSFSQFLGLRQRISHLARHDRGPLAAAASVFPRIAVIGVGGGGGKAINRMIRSGFGDVSYVAADTDSVALKSSLAERRIQLEPSVIADRAYARLAAPDRSASDGTHGSIREALCGKSLAFVTATLSGRTGSVAPQVIARVARSLRIPTVGVVTIPFSVEGADRRAVAFDRLPRLLSSVDSLLVFDNDEMIHLANPGGDPGGAFRTIDDALLRGIGGIAELVLRPGLVNLDFADIRTIMKARGYAAMGVGEACGPLRAVDSARAALGSPAFDGRTEIGARGILVNVSGGEDLTLREVDRAMQEIKTAAHADANLIFGSSYDRRLSGRMRVTVFATGLKNRPASRHFTPTRSAGRSRNAWRARWQAAVAAV